MGRGRFKRPIPPPPFYNTTYVGDSYVGYPNPTCPIHPTMPSPIQIGGIDLSICQFTDPPIGVYIYLSIKRELSTYQSTDLSICEPILLPIYQSAYQFLTVDLSLLQPINLSAKQDYPPSIYNLPINIELSIYRCVNLPTNPST